jgi:hypothetical protein
MPFRAAQGHLGEFNEVDQVHAGFLDTNTTLVALTIGGNDADFSGTLQSSPSGVRRAAL